MQTITMLFSDYTFCIVALGASVLGALSGFLGTFSVLRGQSLLGDGVSHAALPGVALAFLITQNKNTEVLLFGALSAGLIATFCILGIIKITILKFDSALALVMAVFFGVGIVLLTIIQKMPSANKAGLDSFIYGQASTLLRRDIFIICLCAVAIFFIVILFWKEFKVLCFDAEFAQSLGMRTKVMQFILSFLIVLTIVLGLQTVGVVLMSAMLVAPAVAARQFSNKLWVVATLSAVFGAFSSIAGVMISSAAQNMPTGPVIVVCASAIAVLGVAVQKS